MNFRHGECIEVIYIDNKGKLTQRHIRVIAQRKGKILVYCFTKRKLRSFTIENILGMRKVTVA